MRSEWSGNSYELLTKNCNHFCEALAKELECQPTPPWLNRMASGADATITFTNEAAALARHIGSNVSSAACWVRDSVSKMWMVPSSDSGDGCSGAEASMDRAGIPVRSDEIITPKHGMMFFASQPRASTPASYSSDRRDGRQSATEERPTSAPVPEAGFARLGRINSDRASALRRPSSGASTTTTYNPSGKRDGLLLCGETRSQPEDIMAPQQTSAIIDACRPEQSILQSAAAAAAAAQAAAQAAAAMVARSGMASGTRETGGEGSSETAESGGQHLLDA